MALCEQSRVSQKLVLLCLLLVWPAFCRAADWPQFRGPNHDGILDARIKTNWTGSVTNPIWMVRVTNSLCGFTVSGGRAFSQMNRTIFSVPKEVCVALSVTNGAELWAATLDDADYPDVSVGFDDGPRTTPTFYSDSVFVLTSYLKLYRLAATNGAVLWSKDLLAFYGGTNIRFQNAASPVIENDMIYLNSNAGSSNLMAFSTTDGGLVWRAENEEMIHSTPVLATIQGVRQLIFATGSGLISLNPLTGERLWRCDYPFHYGGYYSVAASPLVNQDMVFLGASRSYSYTSFVMQVTVSNDVWSTTRLWAATNNDASTTFTTPVARDGFMYGMFGLDVLTPLCQLKCIEMRTGQVKWAAPGFGRGGLLMVGDYLMALTEKCDLVLAQVNTNAYVEVGRFRALPAFNTDNNKCWNVPAIADGKAYLRSTSWGAAYDFWVPEPPARLMLDPPQPSPGNSFDLTIRTVNGTPLDSNRLAGMEVWSSTDLSLAKSNWPKLTNSVILSNGVGRVQSVNSAGPNRFFIVRELN